MTTDDVVIATDVRKRYGRISALDGVSLGVRRGEIFGLLGANGAGKTTLIKTLVGSSRPSGGAVRVLGMDPRARANDVRPLIGYMPQAPALYEDLSPRHNLRFFGRAYAVDALEQRIAGTLDLIGLRGREHDPVYALSGGMKQRVSLACALLHEPRVLFLDEPTAGVDPKLRETFWRHFRAVAAKGATLVISTHQMDEAMLCDRLAILRGGTVLACDTPRELLRRGQAHVRISRGSQTEEVTLANYETELPRLLQERGLDASITRVEVEHDSLETILLAMIAAREPPASGALQ